MTTALERTLLGEASAYIAERMGLHFPEERWPDLARGLRNAGHELGLGNPDAVVGWLKSREPTTGQIEMLASHLTVGETYFFRDPASFEAVQQVILPPLVARRSEAGRSLRLWSAGCCTGEEAYSLAITCARALPDLGSWHVSILATDINPKFLAKAEAGVYSEWSFRGAPPWLRERFFSPAHDKKLTLDPTVKSLVHFAYLNLAEDVYPSLHNHTNAMDVIFCRNVLMYFTPSHQRRVVTALHRCLVDGGCLLVNPAEASTSLFPMFAVEKLGEVIVYRKTARPACDESRPGLAEPATSPPVPVPEPALTLTRAYPPPDAPAEPIAPAPPISPTAAAPREDFLALATTLANQGKLEEAFAACGDAIAAERTNPDAHFLNATICDELGRLEEAVAAMGKVLYLDQDCILAHHALGDLYKRLGRKKESARHFAVAIGLLATKSRDEIVAGSDGLTCGRLLESAHAMAGA